jgi:replicative DNA helicase
LSDVQQVHSPTLAETIIIKAIYTNVDNLVNIAARLDVDDFNYKPYRILYHVIKKLAASNTVVSSDSILAYLQSRAPNNYKDILDVGGAVWLDSLYDPAYKTSVSLDEHIETIIQQSDTKRVNEAVNQLQQKLQAGTTYETALEEFERTIQGIRLRGKGDEIKPIGEGIREMLNRIAQRDESILGIDISGKFPNLNKMIKRLQNNRLTVILANYKSGKTALLLEIAWYVACELGQPVAYLDSEMFEDEMRLRLLAKITGFPMDYIKEGWWANLDEHKQIICDAAIKIEQTPFYWMNCNRMSRSQIVALAKLSQLKYGTRLLVYDYIKPDSENTDGRIDKQIAQKVDMLKEDIAKACSIPVLSAVQLNDSTGKAADSKDVYRLADNVILLRKTNEEDPEYGLYSNLLIMDTSRYTEAGQRIGLNMYHDRQFVTE